MQKNFSITRRQILLIISSFIFFVGMTFLLFTYRRDELLFQKLSSQLFQREMTSNTLNMHYTLANPSNYGIYDYKVILPCYSADNHLLGQVEIENVLATLQDINPTNLSHTDQYTRTLLLHSLDNSLALSEYSYYSEPLSPSSGMQSQLPILLAEYTFRTKQDVEDYLKILDQTDEYFASLLTFEQEKAAANLLMPSASLKKVLIQCNTILTKKDLEQGTHFLQTTFKERLEQLYQAKIITKEEGLQYIAKNNRLLETVMLPAYEALYDGLFLLEDESIPMTGLAAKPNGAQYYEYLLYGETGSTLSIPEIKELLSKQLLEEYNNISKIITKTPSLTTLTYDQDLITAFPYTSATQMLFDLQARMEKDFPSLNGKNHSTTAVTVKSVSPNLEDYCAPAFFLTPPLDDTSANVIYINEKNTTQGLDLYTTLAHEGYPGHMYQSVFNNRYQLEQANQNIRQILWYGGYLEGWALYVEFMSFDYASQLMVEGNQPELAAAIELEKHNRSLQLCLYSMLDIMIHYDNASKDQIAKTLGAFGIKNPSSVDAIYQYIVEEPTNYLKYYLGYLEILSLKEQSQIQWREQYSEYAFHDFFLKCGPSDFATMKNVLSTTFSVSP